MAYGEAPRRTRRRRLSPRRSQRCCTGTRRITRGELEWELGASDLISRFCLSIQSQASHFPLKRGRENKGRRADGSAGREGWRAGKRREVKERPPTRDISPRSHQTSPYNNPHLSSASSSLGSNMPNEYWNPEHPPGSTETRRRRGEPPRCVLRWVMRCTNHTHTHASERREAGRPRATWGQAQWCTHGEVGARALSPRRIWE